MADTSTKLVHDTFALDRCGLAGGTALRCLPGFVLPLTIGVLCGHPAAGAVAAAGAFTVGMGSFQSIRNSRVGPMLLAAVGTAVSAIVGTLAGHHAWSLALAGIVWGLVYGPASAVGPAAGYVGLQCVIWLIISGAIKGDVRAALDRGGLVVAGGFVQTILAGTLWWLLPRSALQGIVPQVTVPPNASPTALDFRFGLRVAGTLTVAILLERGLALPNGPWVPMTAVIVLKPQWDQTLQRGISRVVGTLAGAGLATVAAVALRSSPATIAAFTAASAAMCYLLLNTNYAAFSVCITMYVVFLLHLSGFPARDVILHRSLNTVIGGIIGLLAYVPVLRTARRLHPF